MTNDWFADPRHHVRGHGQRGDTVGQGGPAAVVPDEDGRLPERQHPQLHYLLARRTGLQRAHPQAQVGFSVILSGTQCIVSCDVEENMVIATEFFLFFFPSPSPIWPRRFLRAPQPAGGGGGGEGMSGRETHLPLCFVMW